MLQYIGRVKGIDGGMLHFAYGIEKLEIAVIGACYGNRRTGNFNLNIQRNFSVIEVGCDGYSARHLRHKAQTVQSREAGLISNYIVLCPEKPPAKQIPFVWGIVAEGCFCLFAVDTFGESDDVSFFFQAGQRYIDCFSGGFRGCF